MAHPKIVNTMWQSVFGYFGGILLIITLTWRFVPLSLFRQGEVKGLKEFIGSVFWITLGVGGYTYSSRHFEATTTTICFLFAVITIVLSFLTFAHFLAETYIIAGRLQK